MPKKCKSRWMGRWPGRVGSGPQSANHDGWGGPPGGPKTCPKMQITMDGRPIGGQNTCPKMQITKDGRPPGGQTTCPNSVCFWSVPHVVAPKTDKPKKADRWRTDGERMANGWPTDGQRMANGWRTESQRPKAVGGGRGGGTVNSFSFSQPGDPHKGGRRIPSRACIVFQKCVCVWCMYVCVCGGRGRWACACVA